MLRRGCIGLALIVGVLVVVAGLRDSQGTFTDRLEERGPVEFREAVYAGSWEMFLERPLTGWGFHRMPGELPRHVSGYDAKVMYPHNTYLELLAEQGVAGLALYLWLMWELWHLGSGAIPSREKDGFLNQHFHRLWPVLLAVYWVNAAIVVMSYQFVNGLLFTMAGMLAAQQRRAVARESW
jgi:O-antigen ligase